MATQVQHREHTVELTVSVVDRNCFFVAASADANCAVRLEDAIHRSDGGLLEFFTVRNAAPDEVLEMAAEAPGVEDGRLVGESDEGGLFQFVVTGDCVTATLADTGAIARSVTAEDGQGRVVAEVPPHVPVRRVVEWFRDRHAGSELLARRTRNREFPALSAAEHRARLVNALTDRQQEVVRTAYLAGYFNWPRETSAADCAAALDVSQPTFSQHLRTGQHRLFAALFDEGLGEF